MVNSLLYRQWEEANTGDIRIQLIVPQALVPEVISALHNQPGGGHLGMHKTLAKVVTAFTGLGYRRMLSIGVGAARIVLRANTINCPRPVNSQPGWLPHGTSCS